jgi:long-chain acyl-CoA synthetase
MLFSILEQAAERYPDNTAIAFGERRYTYRDLRAQAERLARSLIERGIGPGGRVGLYLYNCPEMVVCYFACFKIGATVVPVNYRLKSDEVRHIVNHGKPNILISQRELFHELAGIIDDLPSLHACYLIDDEGRHSDRTRAFDDLLGGPAAGSSDIDVPGNTHAVVIYTSGTTGMPKGVVLDHDQLLIHTAGHCDLVGYQSQDCTLVCLALSNNFAFSHQMLAALSVGASLEMLPRFDAHEVLDRIENRPVTMLYMMPVMYHALIRLAETRREPIANHLRLAIVAGDTTPLVVFEGFERCLGLEMCEGIGMAETQIYALNPLQGGKKMGSVGLPVPYTRVMVQSELGDRLPPGEVGEIAVAGDIVMRAYLDNPQATAESYRRGWFLTGDLGTFDDDGYLWFRGRRKQLIVHEGSNISPQEVEEVFYHHHAVSEVGVVGIPDDIEGENVHAFVALKPGMDAVGEQELLAFAKHHLADYKLPQSITFIDSLPKGSTGKIDRKRLRQQAIACLRLGSS